MKNWSNRVHLLIGLIAAMEHRLAVFGVVAYAKNQADARKTLGKMRFRLPEDGRLGAFSDTDVTLDESQIRAILDLRLIRMTDAERDLVFEEIANLNAEKSAEPVARLRKAR